MQLTDRQAQVLSFINTFRRAEQCNPTCAEIATNFGFASVNAASEHLRALERKSVIVPRVDVCTGNKLARDYKVAWPYSGEQV